jgi:predicted TIM-barrel fold metal-dependent hydrolase
VNRLITTAAENGIGRGGNIYAELGTTWFSLVRRPREAAHLLGKLIAHFGPDNVIWGTDSIWYGSAQPLIDAFRCFQIPDDMCAEFGYEPLTDEVKAKVLAGNAARLYGIDLGFATDVAARADTDWARELLAHEATARFPDLSS